MQLCQAQLKRLRSQASADRSRYLHVLPDDLEKGAKNHQ